MPNSRIAAIQKRLFDKNRERTNGRKSVQNPVLARMWGFKSPLWYFARCFGSAYGFFWPRAIETASAILGASSVTLGCVRAKLASTRLSLAMITVAWTLRFRL